MQFFGNSISKLQLTQMTLIDITDMWCKQLPLPLEYTNGHKSSVFPSMMWEQFPSPLEYTSRHKPSVFPSMIFTVNDNLCLYSLSILPQNI